MGNRYNIQVEVTDEDAVRRAAVDYSSTMQYLLTQVDLRYENGISIEKVEEIKNCRVFDTKYGKFYVKQIGEGVCGVYTLDDCYNFKVSCNENDGEETIYNAIESYFESIYN